MRVIRIIPVSDLNPPTFLKWISNVCGYINSLPREILHLVFDVYYKDIAYSLPSKGQNDDGQFRHVSDLTQKLPSPSCWKDLFI